MLASSFDLINQAMKGRLAEHLRLWRSEGKGYRTIAGILKQKGYPVSYETVRRWMADHGEASQ